MQNLNALSLGRKLVLGAGVLLLIDTFLHWQEVSFGGLSGGQTAWHGFWGVLLGLMTVVLLAWVPRVRSVSRSRATCPRAS